MGRRCADCDIVLLADVWTQFNKGVVHKCLNCKKKGGFRKAIFLTRIGKGLGTHERRVKQRTITVLFMCEQCEKKSRTLKYCVRHGHDERRVYVQEDDPNDLGDEVMNHDVYEKTHPDANLDPGHDAPLQRRPYQEEDKHQAGANDRSFHGADEALTVQMQRPSHDEEELDRNRQLQH